MIQDEQMRLDLQKWNEQLGKMDKDWEFRKVYFFQAITNNNEPMGSVGLVSPGKVKELLKALIGSGILYNWYEAVLYSFLLRTFSNI
jgi:hypothetical protein